MKKTTLVLALFCCLAAVSYAGSLDTPALGFSGGANFGAPSGSFGWTFTLTGSVSIDNLGYFDFGGNGLAASHAVDIWANDGTLLVSATVPSGTTGFLNNGFRYFPVAPIVLGPGNYTIAGFDDGTSGDPLTVEVSSVSTAPGVAYNGSRSASGASLTFPTGDTSGHANSYFGPNFMFAPAAVPEPAATSLLLLGAPLIAALVHRRRR